MVVARIVKIRNTTLRTFYVKPGDYFYTPSVDGKPCSESTIEVPPGFDQSTEGLTVPWETISSRGLEIGEAESEQILRCIVGPVATDGDNKDWLQFRSVESEPIEEQRWFPLGLRHILGTVGTAVDVALTFRDTRSDCTEQPSPVWEVAHFERAEKAAAHNAVFLNIFDLASALSVPNAILCNTVFTTMGAFHAAIEVYGEEWAFYRTPNPTSCGVCKSLRPRHHPVHVYRQSINLGNTSLKDWEVRYLIRAKLATKWPGGTYDLLRHNCIHFCEELSLALGVQPVPSWVRGLHETGANIFQLPWPLSAINSAIFGRSAPRAIGNRQRGSDGETEENAETASMTASEVTVNSSASPVPTLPSATANQGGAFIGVTS